MVEKKEAAFGRRGLLRRRYMALESKCFSLYQPSLNLSEEEYNRRLEEIKKLGNVP